MKLKKNPQSDPKRNRVIYMQLGLMLVLSFTFFGLEYKTLNASQDSPEEITTLYSPDEAIAIVTLPPSQAVPVSNPIINNEVEVVDDVIELDTSPVDVMDVEPEKPNAIVRATAVGLSSPDDDIKELEEIDFMVIEQIPLFPGCENVPKSEQMDCFNTELKKHIRKNFRYPERAMQDNIQGRVYVQFMIETDGSISVLQVRGPEGGSLLEQEGVRNINKLPRLTPGKQRGKAVRVKYAVPIYFKLQK